jgi:hypothetical protein
MVRARVVPKVATLPELETFRCNNCGEVHTKIKSDE